MDLNLRGVFKAVLNRYKRIRFVLVEITIRCDANVTYRLQMSLSRLSKWDSGSLLFYRGSVSVLATTTLAVKTGNSKGRICDS